MALPDARRISQALPDTKRISQAFDSAMATWDMLVKQAGSLLVDEEDEEASSSGRTGSRSRNGTDGRRDEGAEQYDVESGGDFWSRHTDLESGGYYDRKRFLVESGNAEGWLD